YFFFYLTLPSPPHSPLFPYTTLFRSRSGRCPSKAAPVGAHRLENAPPKHGLQQGGPRPLRRRRPREGRFGSRDSKVPAKRNRAADRKSTRLNSSHVSISYAVFCLKKK